MRSINNGVPESLQQMEKQCFQPWKHKILSIGETTCWPTDCRKINDLIDFYVIKSVNKKQCEIKSYLELTAEIVHSVKIATRQKSMPCNNKHFKNHFYWLENIKNIAINWPENHKNFALNLVQLVNSK